MPCTESVDIIYTRTKFVRLGFLNAKKVEAKLNELAPQKVNLTTMSLWRSAKRLDIGSTRAERESHVVPLRWLDARRLGGLMMSWKCGSRGVKTVATKLR